MNRLITIKNSENQSGTTINHLSMVHLPEIHFQKPPSPRQSSPRTLSPRLRSITPVVQSVPLPLSAPTLKEWVLSQQLLPHSSDVKDIPLHFQIVDVRDDDFEGGHIKGAINVPYHQFSDRVTTLVDELEGKDAVIFHCALSQQRGPSVLPKTDCLPYTRLRKCIWRNCPRPEMPVPGRRCTFLMGDFLDGRLFPCGCATAADLDSIWT